MPTADVRKCASAQGVDMTLTLLRCGYRHSLISVALAPDAKRNAIAIAIQCC